MARSSVTSKDIHTMDMGLKSTGLLMPSQLKRNPLLNQGIKCYVDHVDGLFGKLIPGQVIGVSGAPGAGKTTFLMGLLELISYGAPEDHELESGVQHGPKTCAYISNEESVDFLQEKIDRFGVENVLIANESSVEGVCQTIRDNAHLDVVVVDSLQGLHSTQIDGETKVIKYAGNQLIKTAKETNTVLIVVCHSTVNGRAKGGTKFPHQCDTDLRIDRAGGDTRIIWTEKNRMGRTDTIRLNMYEYGYDFHTLIEPSEDEDEDDEAPAGGERAVRRAEDTKSLMDRIKESDMDSEGLAALCNETGLESGRAERLLREMVTMGHITRTGTRRHNFVWSYSESTADLFN